MRQGAQSKERTAKSRKDYLAPLDEKPGGGERNVSSIGKIRSKAGKLEEALGNPKALLRNRRVKSNVDPTVGEVSPPPSRQPEISGPCDIKCQVRSG